VNAPCRGTSDDRDALAAKLRYQQTKIDGAPDTVLVDAEVVAIIRAQQEWADRWRAGHAATGVHPKYLFLASETNRHADRCYSHHTLRMRLNVLARRLDICDAAGRLVDFNRTHLFRPTAATDLLNAGVPLQIVQRYLGHDSPAMTATMPGCPTARSAVTGKPRARSASTAKPSPSTGAARWPRPPGPASRSAGRPRHWPTATAAFPWSKDANTPTCLTCPMFLTTTEFLPQHRDHREQVIQIITAAQARAHSRLAEMNQQVLTNLDTIITSLHQDTRPREAAADAG
jgi:hypothetical protein